MCGIAGAIDLVGQRELPWETLQAMADAIVHRGPDEDGYFREDGVSMASRRLSIVGLQDGRQPITNEDLSVAVVYNGEIFDHKERRRELEDRGHHFRTSCDTEVIPHLWEERGEKMFDALQGQYAFALYDRNQRRVILARDRFGICPLYWTRQGDWLLFASEIKALLASGMVEARPNLNGINHVFTFFAQPGPMTCFEGISILLPGHYLDVRLGSEDSSVADRTHWELTFPDQGEEDNSIPEEKLVDQFEEVLYHAVERRLRADVPVVSYLSGGVDSSLVVAMANKVRGESIPTFTIQVDDARLDESSEARFVADHLGCDPTVVRFGAEEVLGTYSRLVTAAERPVIDTSCAGLLLLAQQVRASGYKVALTGEGADDWLAGYPWYKVHKVLSFLDVIPGLRLSNFVRRSYLRIAGMPQFPRATVAKAQKAAGGHCGWMDVYGMVSMSKLRLYSSEMWDSMKDVIAYEELELNLEQYRRWDPLNRALALGARVHLPGSLLNAKGDRVAMHSSVETRYPFLDEQVCDFLAGISPRWKLRGFKEKYLLRRLAERWLPKSVAWRRKAMFRAPFDSFHVNNPPPFVEQLLSEESLKKTGYFDAEAVKHWRTAFQTMKAGTPKRYSIEMGLAGALSTQLWHHLFIDASLADLPGLTFSSPKAKAPVPVSSGAV